MTETTAKKGMTRFKTGHGKNDFDFDYLQALNYDDKRTLKQVIETLFTEIKRLKEEVELKDKEIVEMSKKNYEENKKRLDTYDKTFEQSLKDFLKRGF